MSHAQQTLKQWFSHPTSHNIHWRDIVHMFEGLGGTCDETKHDHLKVKLAGKEMSFSIPKGGNHALSSDDEIGAIRHFVKDCGLAPEKTH